MTLPILLALAIFPADTAQVRSRAIQVAATPELLRVQWTGEDNRPWTAEFSLDDKQPLIKSIAAGGSAIVQGARPQYWIETGKRRGGWDQFFDFPPSHPEGTRRFQMQFQPTRATASSQGDRVQLLFEGLRLGIFKGSIAYTFFPGSQLIQQEAVVSTEEPGTAFYYDAGFEWNAENDQGAGRTMATQVAYFDTNNALQSKTLPFFASERQPLEARYRSLAAKTEGGSLAIFPPPHQYMMPRDFTSNLGFVWARSFRGAAALGIRQLPDENWVYYPWMNAPPGTTQRLALFLQLSPSSPNAALEAAVRYTHRDRFPALPGYKTLAAHWHFAFSVQAAANGPAWQPPFKPVLKRLGIDAAMIADFHGDGHPRDTTDLRLQELENYYRACRAQSDPTFLLIPAEEANVHLGGHWILAFPKPVQWFMSRQTGQPFTETHPKYGSVFRTGDAADMLRLIREQNGLAYTAHPRTKGSMGFPDKYQNADFFKDPAFLGAGWKAMPADLSTLRQGVRALNLLDDMNNWGGRKRLLAEVDMFQVDSTHELYGHMNANYVRIGQLPSFDDYGQMLQALKRGDYFVSQGQVLLPRVKIEPGLTVTALARYTFPLAQAVVVWGDGANTHRETIPAAETHAFEEKEFNFKVPAPGAKWARLEFWDVAGNGAFTNPVWFGN